MEGWALAYEVTARKWRPQEFDGVIGQEHVTTTLKNAIQAGQIAHAYLFAGPRGVGKTTTARILAKALNCVDGPTVTPCNACTFCQEISEGRSVDVLEIDGASNNRVEQVRTHLLESVKYTPSQGKHKIYIIDEVHMLTKEAFNALLKTLEEPPSHVYFIFATTDPRKVIPTVLSRCQRFDFRRISSPTIVDHLAMISEKSGYDVEREALALIARRVDGSMRDAESLLDQIVAFGGAGLTAREAAEVLGVVDQDVYFELLDVVADQDVPRGLDLVDRVFGQGHDLEEIILGVLEHLRNLLVVKAAPEAETLIGDAALALDRYRAQAGRFETEDLLRLSQLATQVEQSVKQSALPRVQLETGVVRMIRMARSVQLTDVMARLSDMARRVGPGEKGDASGAAGAEATDSAGSHAAGSDSASLHAADAEATGRTVVSPPGPAPAPSVEEDRSPGASEASSATEASTASAESSASTETSASTKPPAASTEPSTATPASESSSATPTLPKLDLRAARERWPSIVEEITRQRGVLGRQLEEIEITGFSPADDEGSGGPATITLGFGAGLVFVKERVEKRENSVMIQSVCAKVLGTAVRIECEIDERAAEDNGKRRSNDAGAEMAGDSEKAEAAGTEMAGDSEKAEAAGTEMAGDSEKADDGGAGLDEYLGTAEDPVHETQDTHPAGRTAGQADHPAGRTAGQVDHPAGRTAGQVDHAATKSTGQAANTRAGAAKDPAVRKIVEAFDGQIVTD